MRSRQRILDRVADQQEELQRLRRLNAQQEEQLHISETKLAVAEVEKARLRKQIETLNLSIRTTDKERSKISGESKLRKANSEELFSRLMLAIGSDNTGCSNLLHHENDERQLTATPQNTDGNVASASKLQPFPSNVHTGSYNEKAFSALITKCIRFRHLKTMSKINSQQLESVPFGKT